MRIPRFWAEESHVSQDDRGDKHTFWAWGWSFDNIAEAREAAITRAKRIKDFVLNDKDLDTYDYLDRPMREEIVESDLKPEQMEDGAVHVQPHQRRTFNHYKRGYAEDEEEPPLSPPSKARIDRGAGSVHTVASPTPP